MKTIEISIDEETYRLVRDKASEQGTSVSALVGDFLLALVRDQVTEVEFDRLRHVQDESLAAIHARGGGLRSLDNLPRGDLHQRDSAAHQN